MKKFLNISACFFAALLFCGCSHAEEVTPYVASYGESGCSFYLYSMNTEALINIGEPPSKERDGRVKRLFDEAYSALNSIENSLSATVEGSDIQRFNAAPAGAWVQIGQTAFEALTTAKQMYSLTQGYYNPAVCYGVEAFGFNGAKTAFPATEEELPAVELTDKYAELAASFGELVLTQKDGEYYAVKPQKTVEAGGQTLTLKLDLGGIGKGYAADRLDALLDGGGFEYSVFNFGSSSLAVNSYTKAQPDFTLGLTDPRGSGAYLNIKMHGENVSSGGDYENYFVLDGTRYCHIFNPFTCRPVQSGMMSATVIGGSAAENDALTTAILAMGPQTAVEFIGRELTGRKVFFTYTKDQTKYYYTNVTAQDYTLLNGEYLPLAAGETDVP